MTERHQGWRDLSSRQVVHAASEGGAVDDVGGGGFGAAASGVGAPASAKGTGSTGGGVGIASADASATLAAAIGRPSDAAGDGVAAGATSRGGSAPHATNDDAADTHCQRRRRSALFIAPRISSFAMTPVAFHFDFLSPYAYLAWTQIRAIAGRCDREVHAVPTLLAALLDAAGSKGPAEIPAKRVYVFKDTFRTAKVLGVPFGPPPSHPFNPLLALRIASLPMAENDRHRVVDALFAESWGGGRRGVDRPEVVAAILEGAGLDGHALVERAGSVEAKAALRAQSDDAIAKGVFGVPTTIVDGEIFFGFDGLGHAERRMLGKDPFDPQELVKWAFLPASATRPGSRG